MHNQKTSRICDQLVANFEPCDWFSSMCELIMMVGSNFLDGYKKRCGVYIYIYIYNITEVQFSRVIIVLLLFYSKNEYIYIYYMEESVLLGTKPFVDSIRHFIRDPSGVFSVCHLCECRIVQ